MELCNGHLRPSRGDFFRHPNGNMPHSIYFATDEPKGRLIDGKYTQFCILIFSKEQPAIVGNMYRIDYNKPVEQVDADFWALNDCIVRTWNTKEII